MQDRLYNLQQTYSYVSIHHFFLHDIKVSSNLIFCFYLKILSNDIQIYIYIPGIVIINI